nr:NACHT domain-containing protein [Neochlamydia sp. AcF84]
MPAENVRRLADCVEVVCRIYHFHPARRGTGFLIGPGLLLTNNHVLRNKQDAREARADFFYEEGRKDVVEVKFNPDEEQGGWFYTSPEPEKDSPFEIGKLDFTIVALKAHPKLDRIYQLGLSMFSQSFPKVNGPANIIQHPLIQEPGKDGTSYKKWAFRGNRILKIKKHKFVVRYETTTMPGSSGAPVLDDKGDVFAIHHAKYLGNDDEVLYNEAILIQAIVEELKQKNLIEKVKSWICPCPLDVQNFTDSLRSFYLSQETIYILKIKAEQEWKFEVPLEEVYVRLGIIESKERIERDQALDKHSDHIQDDRIPTSESIYEPKKNIEIEKLFEHASLEKKDAKRIYIQGAAGIGKSTLCHYIAYRWAKEELWKNVFSYLFWIPLRNLTLKKYPDNKEYTPADLIAREYAGKIDSRIIDSGIIEACINDATFREKTLLVLDGYDELSAEAQGNNSLAKAFNELKKIFPHIIITSRPGRCSFNRSCELELLGFDKEGVERYIDRFFKQVQAEEKKQKLYHRLQTSPQVASLAQIPINLTLLCCLFNEDPEVFDSTQPITMTAIYERIVNWMYKWFLLRRIGQVHSPQTMEKILTEKNLRRNKEVAKIATVLEEMANFAMENNTLYLNKEEIEDILGRNAITRDDVVTSNELTDCGLLRIPEEKGYFIHLTFQEFLTASKIANKYLRGENWQECQDFVRNYKFEPRYSLVLRMIAGYLSLSTSRNRRYLNSNPLQSFFNDLFAEPHDLAVRSELYLIAGCFEECQNPNLVRQYEGFIELVKDYMIDFSSLGLSFEGLLRNKNLLNHPKVVHTIERLLSDPQTVQNLLENLENLIRTRQRLSLAIVRSVVLASKNPANPSDAKIYAISVIRAVVQQGDELFEEAIAALTQILKEDDYDAKISALDALEEAAQQEGELPEEALNALIQILDEGDSIATLAAVNALRAVAEQGGKLPKEALDALIHILEEGDKGGSMVTVAAVDALEAVAGQGGEFAEKALVALIQLLDEGDFDDKEYAFYAIKAVAEQRGKLPKKALDDLLQILKNGDPDAQKHAVDTLRVVVEQRGELSEETLDALIHILEEGDKGDSITIVAAAKALRAVVQQGRNLPKEALNAITHILEEGDKGDSMATVADVDALEAVVEQRGKLPKKALDDLLQILKDRDPIATLAAAEALRAVAQQGGNLPKKVVDALFQIFKKGNSDVRMVAGVTLSLLAEQEGEITRQALPVFIQILREGDYIDQFLTVEIIPKMIQQGDELSKKAALRALIQILKNGDIDAKIFTAYTLEKLVEQGGKLPEEALDALIQILNEGDLNVTRSAADALKKLTGQGCKFPKETITALIQILQGGDSNATIFAGDILGKVAEQGGKLSKEALAALIQISKEGGDTDAKIFAVDVLKKVDKNVLLEMEDIQAFPLIAEICFFNADSFSVKDQQLQISDKAKTYFRNHKLKLTYEKIRKKLPRGLAKWRKRLDNLSRNGSSQGHTDQT